MGMPPFWELKKFSIDKYLKAVLQKKWQDFHRSDWTAITVQWIFTFFWTLSKLLPWPKFIKNVIAFLMACGMQPSMSKGQHVVYLPVSLCKGSISITYLLWLQLLQKSMQEIWKFLPTLPSKTRIIWTFMCWVSIFRITAYFDVTPLGLPTWSLL